MWELKKREMNEKTTRSRSFPLIVFHKKKSHHLIVGFFFQLFQGCDGNLFCGSYQMQFNLCVSSVCELEPQLWKTRCCLPIQKFSHSLCWVGSVGCRCCACRYAPFFRRVNLNRYQTQLFFSAVVSAFVQQKNTCKKESEQHETTNDGKSKILQTHRDRSEMITTLQGRQGNKSWCFRDLKRL